MIDIVNDDLVDAVDEHLAVTTTGPIESLDDVDLATNGATGISAHFVEDVCDEDVIRKRVMDAMRVRLYVAACSADELLEDRRWVAEAAREPEWREVEGRRWVVVEATGEDLQRTVATLELFDVDSVDVVASMIHEAWRGLAGEAAGYDVECDVLMVPVPAGMRGEYW